METILAEKECFEDLPITWGLGFPSPSPFHGGMQQWQKGNRSPCSPPFRSSWPNSWNMFDSCDVFFCQTWTEMLLQIQEEFAGRLWYKCAFATFDFATFDFLRLQPPSKEECMTERKLIFLVPSKNPPLCVVLHNLCTNYKGGIFPLRNASLTAMGLIFLGHCQRIPLSLYLSIFWLRSLLRETIVTVMEVSFLDHHSLQPVYISYSIFLSPIFDDGNVVTFHDPS